MDEMVKAWGQILYTDEIDDTLRALSCERLWLKESTTAEEQNSHLENIRRYEEYIETLEGLKESFILKNGD